MQVTLLVCASVRFGARDAGGEVHDLYPACSLIQDRYRSTGNHRVARNIGFRAVGTRATVRRRARMMRPAPAPERPTPASSRWGRYGSHRNARFLRRQGCGDRPDLRKCGGEYG
jgi:hypothetical protein